MISAASCALADSLTNEDIACRYLMPDISRLWEVSGIVGLAVARHAVADGVASVSDDQALQETFDAYRWRPKYPAIVVE